MLDKIIAFSIKNKIIIALMTFALIIWGIWSATKIPIDALPDITNNQVQIITVCPTLASQEVEQLVTYPIEQSIANLPDIEELRSISRFGLSVITVVFKEHVDVYFARQLINEKLKEAETKIPSGVGSPELAPVSTGLGEIYQYIIHPKKGSENKYSAMELRTMQDWIVARQLYGTAGIAEVNSFGGELKQYEVSVNPNRLLAMNISIPELFLALESIISDSIFLYKVANQKVIETEVLGENLPFSDRKIKYQNPIFEINLHPNEQAQYYLKAVSDGQPMNLTAELLNTQGFNYWNVRKMFFLGIVYGIMALILILNFSFYLITDENIYIIFSLQVAFSLLCIAYFDGFIYQYIFPNSGYWSSQTIAIGIGCTFICSNRFTYHFFNLKKIVPWAYQSFRYVSYLTFVLLMFSFLHPVGFNTFIISMTALTSLVALLLIVSIFTVKRRGFASYFFGLLATVCLIIFGTFFQLFLIGLVPGVFFSHYAMHLAVVSQSVFLALAVLLEFLVSAV